MSGPPSRFVRAAIWGSAEPLMVLAAAVPHLQLITGTSAWAVVASAAALGSLALSIGSWVRVGHMASPRSGVATAALLLLCIGICAAGGWATAWKFL